MKYKCIDRTKKNCGVGCDCAYASGLFKTPYSSAHMIESG